MAASDHSKLGTSSVSTSSSFREIPRAPALKFKQRSHRRIAVNSLNRFTQQIQRQIGCLRTPSIEGRRTVSIVHDSSIRDFSPYLVAMLALRAFRPRRAGGTATPSAPSRERAALRGATPPSARSSTAPILISPGLAAQQFAGWRFANRFLFCAKRCETGVCNRSFCRRSLWID